MTGRHGKILLVGLGPGSRGQMTARARTAIEEADVVIGYSRYIGLVRDLLDGKEVVRKGMTEEIDRCIEAWERARRGKTVALVSSGDSGVYGMAGPTFELLFELGWTPEHGIEVEVIPGTTALNAAASLVGAPLTHDFCAISLSDLLTPWPVIARRLESAARGDFVIALYNPGSGRRTRQIVEAQRILLRHRAPDTPAAIVKSAYRRKQAIQMVTLERMVEREIGMLTTVLIGNSQTFLRHGLMVTPRGYANKYDRDSGELREGEQAGRSLRMGLLNWHACVRDWLQRDPARTPRQAAARFEVPLGEICTAIAAADPDSPAGAWEAAPVRGTRIERLLDALTRWGPLRLQLQGGAGMTCGSDLERADWIRGNGHLRLVAPPLHLDLDPARLATAWLLGGGQNPPEVLFTEPAGEPVFSLALPAGGSHETFAQAWRELAARNAPGSAGNAGESPGDTPETGL